VGLRVSLAGLVLLTLVPALGVCSPEREALCAAVSGPGEIEQPSVPSVLVGLTWQFVEIVSMDDRVDEPDDRSLYTMAFKVDGGKYVEQERLPAEPTPEGTPLLDGDYSCATGLPLEPWSE
jgi:hypothetical protein